MSKLLEHLQQICEEKQFRLTIQNNKFHLVWVVGDNVRQADFDSWTEVNRFIGER